jgi:hypothetical protein
MTAKRGEWFQGEAFVQWFALLFDSPTSASPLRMVDSIAQMF